MLKSKTVLRAGSECSFSARSRRSGSGITNDSSETSVESLPLVDRTGSPSERSSAELGTAGTLER
jgi:hypothetical protein